MKKIIVFILFLLTLLFAVSCDRLLAPDLESATFVYDGNPKSLEVTNLPEGATVEYTGNSATDVGEYDVTATVTLEGGDTVELAAIMTIAPAEYDLSGITFADAEYKYDTENHSLQISGELPEGLSVRYTGNSRTNVGSYEVAALFENTNPNYKTPDPLVASLTILYNPQYTVGFVDQTFRYDGSVKSLEATNLPEGATVEYYGNARIEVGEQDVCAIIKLADGTTFEKVARLTVAKGIYDVSHLKFDKTWAIYDGNSHRAELVGELPEGVSVTYVGNGGIYPGNYCVIARFDVSESRYEPIPDMYTVFTIAYDLSDFVRFDSQTFAYDGEAKSIYLTGSLPDDVSVVYENNGQKEAGRYTVTARFTHAENPDVEYPVLTATLTIKSVHNVTYNLGYDNLITSYRVVDGNYAPDYAPVRSGYTFVGWETVSGDSWVPQSNPIVSDITIYAVWREGDSDLPSYDWDVTDLIFQMTDNSNNEELSSECKRYLAGQDKDASAHIDDEVAIRNEEAYELTKVNVTYLYLSDTALYTWGKNSAHIETTVLANSKDSPDMYCNFVYDMVNASLKSCFANLFSEARGDNYFSFVNMDKDEEFKDTGDGYMYEYMKSLTLSKHKMYCLSSDYFIDMVRAFYVVPVNISMLNSIKVADEAGKYNSDRTGDNQFDIDDFYELIFDGEWNYTTLMEFCSAVSADTDKAVTGETWNLNDTIGFAISASNGMSSAGMLYTTSITIIAREWDAIDDPFGEVDPNEPGHGNFIYNDYMYWYPETNDELINYCNNLSTLFSSKGVIAVGDDDTCGYGAKSLIAIRERFASNKVLFGGVICVGSLEHESYQNMNANTDGDGGFGIVPVPLYRTVDPETGEPDKYLTQIHNIGRIGAISHNTLKFSQCTAFLDYQSTHSTDILNEYYDFQLSYDTADGNSGNVEMLQYIRENVRSSFDKAFEDAIGKFFGSIDVQANENKWHYMIMGADFKMSNMAIRYAAVRGTKEGHLQSLVGEYDTLPD